MVSEKAKMNKLKKLDKLVDDIHGEGFFSDMASKVKRIINPVLTSMGIYSTDIGIDKPSNQPAKQGYLETLLQGRNNYPPPARKILAQYGNLRITKAEVIRQPIMAITPAIFNVASFGAFQETLDKQPYDTLFHLRSVFTLEGGAKVQVEKSEVIHIGTKIHQIKGQQEKEVQLPPEPLTINQLLDGAKNILKGNMFSYDAFKNNCQDFQLAIYRGSNLLTPELETFIKQDVSEIAHENPLLSKLANAITGIGGKFNELIYGAGINKKYNKTHLVQSVLFDKKKWKVNEAVEWLQDNNYISPKVDTTSHYLRFRQLDPKDYPKPKWHYTTHRLGNGIDLIILYRQSDKELPITTVKGMSKKQIHSIMTGSGDLIHIDLGSHNATGKSKNSMEGGVLQHDPPNPLGLKSNVPHQSYNPLDMKLTSQNVMLNNLKKSDLQDLDRLKTEAKRSMYDRDAVIQKIKSITKGRVKTEVKKVKTAKPRNLKTRGSPQAKIEALEKLNKSTRKKRTKKITL
jgi:hypothetical protein